VPVGAFYVPAMPCKLSFYSHSGEVSYFAKAVIGAGYKFGTVARGKGKISDCFFMALLFFEGFHVVFGDDDIAIVIA